MIMLLALAGSCAGGAAGTASVLILTRDAQPGSYMRASASGEARQPASQGHALTPGQAGVSSPAGLNLADLVARVSPAVVTVVGQRTPPPGAAGSLQGVGSGVILDGRGLIVTSQHLADGAAELRVVTAGGQHLAAEVVAHDAALDLAALRVVRPDSDLLLPAVSLGDSDSLRVGDWVFAVGSVLGSLDNSVTLGIVSGLGRDLRALSLEPKVGGLIQTDAAVNQGNSGGPLMDMTGHVVGITTLIVRGGEAGQHEVEGVSFAVPAKRVGDFVESVRRSAF
jgi:S1-C subfamily serine protease